MAFTVRVLRRAAADADAIYQWIAKRSSAGAMNWYQAFLNALIALERDADSCAVAPEAKRLRIDLRQRLFKTSRGRSYRMLFVIAGRQVGVLRVRGPGQRPLRSRDLGGPA